MQLRQLSKIFYTVFIFLEKTSAFDTYAWTWKTPQAKHATAGILARTENKEKR
jgi:hypothetical protein